MTFCCMFIYTFLFLLAINRYGLAVRTQQEQQQYNGESQSSIVNTLESEMSEQYELK